MSRNAQRHKTKRKSKRKQHTELGMFSLAPYLFEIAKSAYDRTKGHTYDREIKPREPIVAIVFSAVALEAFINEVAVLADQPLLFDTPEEPDSVVTFAERGRKFIEEKIPIRSKFMIAREVFAGQPYNKDAQPYKDFHLLIDLRNALVHLRPIDVFEFSSEKGMLVEPPEIIEELQSRGFLARPEVVGGGPWVLWINTPAAARWACNVTTKMVQSIMEVVPESQFKNQLEFSYGSYSEHFRLVE